MPGEDLVSVLLEVCRVQSIQKILVVELSHEYVLGARFACGMAGRRIHAGHWSPQSIVLPGIGLLLSPLSASIKKGHRHSMIDI